MNDAMNEIFEPESRACDKLLRKRKRMTAAEAQSIWERSRNEEPLELEKNDLKAIILAALIVFIPFVLAFGGMLLLVWWFIIYVWGG